MSRKQYKQRTKVFSATDIDILKKPKTYSISEIQSGTVLKGYMRINNNLKNNQVKKWPHIKLQNLNNWYTWEA